MDASVNVTVDTDTDAARFVQQTIEEAGLCVVELQILGVVMGSLIAQLGATRARRLLVAMYDGLATATGYVTQDGQVTAVHASKEPEPPAS